MEPARPDEVHGVMASIDSVQVDGAQCVAEGGAPHSEHAMCRRHGRLAVVGRSTSAYPIDQRQVHHSIAEPRPGQGDGIVAGVETTEDGGA